MLIAVRKTRQHSSAYQITTTFQVYSFTPISAIPKSSNPENLYKFLQQFYGIESLPNLTELERKYMMEH